MKKGFVSSLGALLISSGSVLAQTQPTLPPSSCVPSALGAPIVTEGLNAKGPSDCWDNKCCTPVSRFWSSAEYLYWRVNNAPIRVPLVTLNNDPTTIGALNEPGTTILFGAGSGVNANFGWFSGGRVTVGGWLDGDHQFGAEVSGFLLENRTVQFGSSSVGTINGGPVLSVPFTATQPFGFNPAGPTSLNSGGGPNNIGVALTSRLWGAEGNGVINFFANDRVHVVGLIGFRYLDLLENLTLTDTFLDPATNLAINVTDGFGTRNQFYGGQIGARFDVNFGRFNLETTGKVALGNNHETLNIVGSTNVPAGAFGLPASTTPAGTFAEPSNSGRFNRNVFAVVPEVTVKLGFAVTQHVQSFVGYNFLYLNNSARPGNQIDSNVNPTQSAFFVPPGTLMGLPAPVPSFLRSSFVAQGVNFGVEFKY